MGGTARDVCRPHQEERPAQGQVESVRYASATTGGDDRPPSRAKVWSVRSAGPGLCVCAVVSPVWRIFRARRRPEEGSELKPAMGAKCRKAPLESLKLAAVMPRNDSDTKGDRPREVDQAGLSLPRSMWGVTVLSA